MTGARTIGQTVYEVLRCRACGALDPGGRRHCPRCGVGALAPAPVSGRGRLVSWTLVRRPPAGFDSDGPYAVALVDLEEGVRVTARLAGTADAVPAPSIELGVDVRIVAVTNGLPVVEVQAQ